LNSTEASTAARIEDAQGVAAAERQAALGERVRSLRLPAEVRSHRPGTSLVAWLLALVMAGAAGTLGFLYYQQVSRNAAAAGGSNPPPSGAGNGGNAGATDDSKAAPSLAAPAAASGSIALEAKGYVIPRRQILVSPQVNGRLLKVLFEEGQRVARDQVLAEIETTDYLADHQRALAAAASSRQRLQELESGNRPEEIAQAEAELAEARALLPQAEAEWKRNDELRASRTIAQLQFEQSEATYLSLKKRVDRLEAAVTLMRKGPRQERIEAARADVQQAEADVVRTKWRLDNCTVRAPISGTILKKNAEEGNIVNPIAFNGSFSLCDMADLSDLEVELFIQERDIARVFAGQHCKVRAEAYPDRTYDGLVSRLMPIADRAKGAVPVRVKLTVPADEEGVYLKPEMGAVVTFLNASTDGQPAAVSSTQGP
jgi:multidrug resistance efflux pump